MTGILKLEIFLPSLNLDFLPSALSSLNFGIFPYLVLTSLIWILEFLLIGTCSVPWTLGFSLFGASLLVLDPHGVKSSQANYKHLQPFLPL
jgi:hypothetical protein